MARLYETFKAFPPTAGGAPGIEEVLGVMIAAFSRQYSGLFGSNGLFLASREAVLCVFLFG